MGHTDGLARFTGVFLLSRQRRFVRTARIARCPLELSEPIERKSELRRCRISMLSLLDRGRLGSIFSKRVRCDEPVRIGQVFAILQH